MAKLNKRQSLFVAEYLKDLNATQAAIRAGYSVKTANVIASENLSKPDIQRAIQAAMDERSRKTEIDANFVLTGIVATIKRCAELEPVIDAKGFPVLAVVGGEARQVVTQYDAKSVLKGYELLGKHLKLFTDKMEHSGPGGLPLVPPNLNITFPTSGGPGN